MTDTKPEIENLPELPPTLAALLPLVRAMTVLQAYAEVHGEQLDIFSLHPRTKA